MALNVQLDQLLQTLQSSVPDVRGAVIASTDGMPIAHSLAGGDQNRVSAMVATALGLGKRICESIGAGQFTETSVSGNAGLVYVYSAGPKGVLAVLCPPGSNIGLVNLEARDSPKKIEAVLGN